MFNRIIILSYFGEDTSKLVSRDKCCDNCTLVLTSQLLVANRLLAAERKIIPSRNSATVPFRSHLHKCGHNVDKMFGSCVNCRPSTYRTYSEEGYGSFNSNIEEQSSDEEVILPDEEVAIPTKRRKF